MFYVGVYALFTSFEFYLKAYIVLLDNEYRYPKKLRKLSHKFSRIIICLENTPSAPDHFVNKIKSVSDRYNLTDEDFKIEEIKYPLAGNMWSMERGIEKGKHGFKDVFKKIEQEINNRQEQWISDTYPRKYSASALISIDYKHKGKNITDEVLNWCKDCRPNGVVVHESVNWPWSQRLKKIPFDELQKKCAKCNSTYLIEIKQ